MISSILGFIPWWGYGGILALSILGIFLAGWIPVLLKIVTTINDMLKVVPPIILAGLLALAIATAAVQRNQLIDTKAKFKAYKAEVVQKATLDENNRLKSNLRIKELNNAKIKKAQDEQNARVESANKVIRQYNTDNVTLNSTVSRLHDTITFLNGRTGPAERTAEEYKRDATIARGFLDECSKEYSKVAGWAVGYYADSLRN